MYGCEVWSLRKADNSRLKVAVAEMIVFSEVCLTSVGRTNENVFKEL